MVSRVMISVRVGPASTWQWVQVWLHSLPTLTCSVSIRSARRVSCPYSASVASNERRSLAVLFSGLRRTVTLAMSAAAPVRCTGDGFARDRLARAVDDREVPAVRAGVQHIQRLRADFQRDAPTVDVMVVVLLFTGPFTEAEDDDHHIYRRGVPLEICSKTLDVLNSGPYSRHFTIINRASETVNGEAVSCAPDGSCC